MSLVPNGLNATAYSVSDHALPCVFVFQSIRSHHLLPYDSIFIGSLATSRHTVTFIQFRVNVEYRMLALRLVLDYLENDDVVSCGQVCRYV
jgi:hypothetical protein